MIYVLPDTNVLIKDAQIVEKLIDKGFYVVIPVTVIDELDNLKLRDELGYNVRKVGRVIENLIDRRCKNLLLTTNLKEDASLSFKKQTIEF